MPKPTLRTAAPWFVLALILGFIAWKLHTSHFDYAGFVRSCRTADLRLLLLAVLLIQANYATRAMRWAVFLKPILRTSGRPPVSWRALVGPQFVGFTGLAIFGRIGELIQPAARLAPHRPHLQLANRRRRRRTRLRSRCLRPHLLAEPPLSSRPAKPSPSSTKPATPSPA